MKTKYKVYNYIVKLQTVYDIHSIMCLLDHQKYYFEVKKIKECKGGFIFECENIHGIQAMSCFLSGHNKIWKMVSIEEQEIGIKNSNKFKLEIEEKNNKLKKANKIIKKCIEGREYWKSAADKAKGAHNE